jgi:hypothetical protein
MASNQWAISLNDDYDSCDVDSDKDDDSYDETPKGELLRKERKFPRFDGSATVPRLGRLSSSMGL